VTAWVLPTARATDWLPLATTGVALVSVSALTAYGDRWPLGMVGLAAGAVAAATVAGLRDPAADLLAALPTPATTRLAQRLLLLVPVAVATWLAYLWPGQRTLPDPGWPLAPLLALLATGVVAAALAPRPWGLALGVAVPLAWTAAARAGTGLDAEVAEVLLAWQHHPWLVTTAAGAALLGGRTR